MPQTRPASADPPAFFSGRDLKVVGLVGVGHFASHFYFLVLPPLFPLLTDVFDASYTQLGLALAVMALASAIVQAPVGFLVDRFGPGRFLVAGVTLCGLSLVGVGLFPRYDALLVFMVLFGIGDSVFHPADYAILNKTIDPRRMGRAFSVHTFAGHLGFAAAPVTVIVLSEWIGWRGAVVLCGLGGVGIGVLMFLNRDLLGDRPLQTRLPEEPSRSPGGLALLMSLPLLTGFVFYAAVAITGQGMTSFGISALHLQLDLPLAEAGAAVSAYLFAAPAGVVLAGWFVDHIRRQDTFLIICFSILTLAAFAIAALKPSLPVVVVLFAVAGFAIGAVNPARDMLIRSMVPTSDTGKAFGFVTIGLNAGSMLGPLLYGWILDSAEPIAIFWAIGAMSLVTIAVVMATARVQTQAMAASARA